MPQTRQTGAAFLIVVLLFWLLLPIGDSPGQLGSLLSDLAAARFIRYHEALHVLNTTRWGDFAPDAGPGDDAPRKYVNLTGFRKMDGFDWDDLNRFRNRGLQLSRYVMPEVGGKQLWDVGQGEPVWQKGFGTLHGEWVHQKGSTPRSFDSYNLSDIAPGMEWIGDKMDWGRNITGGSGKMVLRVEGNKTTTVYEQLKVADGAPLSGGLLRNIRGTLTVDDTSGSGHVWEMLLWGLHWPKQGVILMTTTSEKFEGIFGLPHFSPSADYYQSSQGFLMERLATTIAAREKNIMFDQRLPWNSDVEQNAQYLFNPAPQCEYILYAQIHPLDRQSLKRGRQSADSTDFAGVIEAMEDELASPLGAPIGHVPLLQMSAVAFSPDCAFFLESKGPPDFPPGEARHLTGVKVELHTHQIKTWLLVFACVVFGQVYLLKDQMKETFTPSTVGRVSFGTISIMVLIDGMTFAAAATWVSSAGATFLPTLELMFASFLAMTIGGSFLAKIYEVQYPERHPRQGQVRTSGATTTNSRNALASGQQSTPDTAAEPLLPAPVTAGGPRRPPSPPVIVPFDGDVDAEINDGAAAVPELPTAARIQAERVQPQSFQTIIGRFIFSSLCISFLTLSSTTWHPTARSIYLNICAFMYLSLWVPQIYRNIMRNCRRALTWQFVIGQSFLRILPVAYFWVKADNFMFAEPDRRAFAILSGWVWLQLFVLGTQEVLGPRYAVPASWAPEAWDYHPVLREDNLEAGKLPIGLVADDHKSLGRSSSIDSSSAAEASHLSSTSSKDETIQQLQRSESSKAKGPSRAIDCSICREILEVPVVKSGSEEDTSVANVFARRMYMVTPCRHIFHTTCLESWMKFRLQCPICREDLPPL